LLGSVCAVGCRDMHFQKRLLPRAAGIVLAFPVHRGVEGDPIKPRRRAGFAREVRQRLPGLEEDLLGEVLAFVAVKRVSARYLDDCGAMLAKPGHEYGLLVFVRQRKTSSVGPVRPTTDALMAQSIRRAVCSTPF